LGRISTLRFPRTVRHTVVKRNGFPFDHLTPTRYRPTLVSVHRQLSEVCEQRRICTGNWENKATAHALDLFVRYQERTMMFSRGKNEAMPRVEKTLGVVTRRVGWEGV
jgi:hypothetical protein